MEWKDWCASQEPFICTYPINISPIISFALFPGATEFSTTFPETCAIKLLSHPSIRENVIRVKSYFLLMLGVFLIRSEKIKWENISYLLTRTSSLIAVCIFSIKFKFALHDSSSQLRGSMRRLQKLFDNIYSMS